MTTPYSPPTFSALSLLTRVARERKPGLLVLCAVEVSTRDALSSLLGASNPVSSIVHVTHGAQNLNSELCPLRPRSLGGHHGPEYKGLGPLASIAESCHVSVFKHS